MKDFALYILKKIVDKPDELSIDEVVDEENSYTLTIKVSKDDMGKIIGKGGRNIQAIRDVIKILALKQDKHVNIVLAE